MRTIRSTPKVPRQQLTVAGPGEPPPQVNKPRPMPLVPKINPASQRDYGKKNPAQIVPPTGLPGQGI